MDSKQSSVIPSSTADALSDYTHAFFASQQQQQTGHTNFMARGHQHCLHSAPVIGTKQTDTTKQKQVYVRTTVASVVHLNIFYVPHDAS